MEPLIKIAVFLPCLYAATIYLIGTKAAFAECLAESRWLPWRGLRGLRQPFDDGLRELFGRSPEPLPVRPLSQETPQATQPGSSPSDSAVEGQTAVGGWKRTVFSQARPSLLLAVVTVCFAAIPFGYVLPAGRPVRMTMVADAKLGLLFFLAFNAVADYVTLSLNPRGIPARDGRSKHSTEQWLTGQLPLAVSFFGVVLLSGSFGLETIVDRQADSGVWWLFVQPVAVVVFVVAAVRGCMGRAAVTTAAGAAFSENASGRTDGRIVLAAWLQGLAFAYLTATLFLGGWHLWGLAPYVAPGEVTVWGGLWRIAVLHGKVLLVLLAAFFVCGKLQLAAASDVAARIARFAPAAEPRTLMAFAALNVLVTASISRFVAPGDLLWQTVAGWSLFAVWGLFAVRSNFTMQCRPVE